MFHICLSAHRGGSASRGGLHPGGLHQRGRGLCIQQGDGVCIQGGLHPRREGSRHPVGLHQRGRGSASKGDGVCIREGLQLGGEVCIHGVWVCIHGEGSASGGGWADTPYRILRDTVNERAVRILLECIIVSYLFSTFLIFW